MKRPIAFLALLGAVPGLVLSLALTLVLVALPAHGQTLPETAECPPYESLGNGPDLILTPGLGSSPQVWEDAKATLSETHTLHLVHIAGFAGRAPNGDPDTIVERAADEIIAYMDCKNITKAAYAGHSMGGFLGLKLAHDHPERIERLVVVDALPFFSLIFAPSATPELVVAQADAMRRQMVAMDDETFETGQRLGVRRLVKNESKHNRVVEWTLTSDRASFASAMHTLTTTDLRAQLQRIQTPTTVIAAANAFAPRARVEALYSGAYEGLSGVDLRIVEDSYHFVMFDQPDAFLAELQRALK